MHHRTEALLHKLYDSWTLNPKSDDTPMSCSHAPGPYQTDTLNEDLLNCTWFQKIQGKFLALIIINRLASL